MPRLRATILLDILPRMHFAVPPRKISHPPPYSRSARLSFNQRRQLRLLGIIACAAVVGIYLLSRLLASSGESIPPGTPEVVLVTILEPDMDPSYVRSIKENRRDYAGRHGYTTFFPSTADYDVGSSPKSWAVIPALRHAMSLHPHSTYFFSLSPHSLVMNPSLSLTAHVMEPKRLESLMLKDKPVVPPDSVIHTFSHLKGDRIDLALTQDGEGLCPESFVLRRGDWANFFLDVWFDPLYRSYNFQKAEGHALEHIVQWHPTILTKLALIPQRTINSYTVDIASRGGKAVTYQVGDFVVRAVGCEKDINRNCQKEMSPWYEQWKRTEAKSAEAKISV